MTLSLDPHAPIIIEGAFRILPIHAPDCRYIDQVLARDGLVKDNLGDGRYRRDGYLYSSGYRKRLVFPKARNSPEYVAEVARWLPLDKGPTANRGSRERFLLSIEELWLATGKPTLWTPADSSNLVCAYFENRIAEWNACEIEVREMDAQLEWLHSDLDIVSRFLTATKNLRNDLSAFTKAMQYPPRGFERTWRFFTDRSLQRSMQASSREYLRLIPASRQVVKVL